MKSNSHTQDAYESPRILEVGDLVELTAQGQGGSNKPCATDDGLSGTVGNCSGNGGGTIGS